MALGGSALAGPQVADSQAKACSSYWLHRYVVVGCGKNGSTCVRSYRLRCISVGLSLIGVATAGLSLELQHGRGAHGLLLSMLVVLSGIVFLYQDKPRVFVVQALIAGWSITWVLALVLTPNIERLGSAAMEVLAVAFAAPFFAALYYVLSDRRR